MDERKRKLAFLPLTIVAASLGLSTTLMVKGLRLLSGDRSEALSDDAGSSHPRGMLAPRRPVQAVATQILARNMFDARTGSLAWQAPVPPERRPSSLLPMRDDGASPPRCPKELRLLASVVNATSPESSLAVVRRAGGTYLLRVGARLDQLTLLALRPARAYLQHRNGAICVLPVFLPAEERPKPEPPKVLTAGKMKKRPALFSPEELKLGIRNVGTNHYVVTRALLVRALGSPSIAARWARFRVSSEGGRVQGLEVLRITGNSPLKQLGLQKGDVVRQLNGHRLHEPHEALQALELLKTNTNFGLSILRKGTPITIYYEVE